MLRTSLRKNWLSVTGLRNEFLSSNAQDFIEELKRYGSTYEQAAFLSSNAQDFIEERAQCENRRAPSPIPEQ